MTDPDRDPKKPAAPQDAWDGRYRAHILADWVGKHRGSFTDAALERSAVAAGYTHEEFGAAAGWAEARASERAALAPVKSTARRGVLAAYGVVWVLFAVVYFGRSSRGYLTPDGNTLQVILTIALAIGLAISLLVIRIGRPDPSRFLRAVTLLLVVPVILLVGVAGLCLPFAAAA